MRSSDLLNLSIYSRGHPTTTQYSKISHDYLASGAARGSLHNNHVPHTTSKPTTGLIRKFIYGPGIDEPIAMINVDAGVETWYFYHYDGLGSVVALSKYNTGTSQVEIVERYSYDAFGTTTITTTSGCTSPGNPYMFTARRLDPETGLYYYRARIYNSALGRFLQPDPIGYADGMNIYAYCGNNPVNWIDPYGLAILGIHSDSRGLTGHSWITYTDDNSVRQSYSLSDVNRETSRKGVRISGTSIYKKVDLNHYSDADRFYDLTPGQEKKFFAYLNLKKKHQYNRPWLTLRIPTNSCSSFASDAVKYVVGEGKLKVPVN